MTRMLHYTPDMLILVIFADEPMDQEADPDHQQPPEFEDQDKTIKLEDPLFEETFIEGFAFCAFDKYTVLEVSLLISIV